MTLSFVLPAFFCGKQTLTNYRVFTQEEHRVSGNLFIHALLGITAEALFPDQLHFNIPDFHFTTQNRSSVISSQHSYSINLSKMIAGSKRNQTMYDTPFSYWNDNYQYSDDSGPFGLNTILKWATLGLAAFSDLFTKAQINHFGASTYTQCFPRLH